MNKLTFAALLLIACGPFTLAQGTYTQIDVPGALETDSTAIDSFGNIVGWYQAGAYVYGFILSNGTFTYVGYSDSYETAFNGINDLGQIVGYSDTGFVYDWPTQTFTEFVDYPYSDWTVPYGINNAGTIVGGYQTNDIYEDAFMLSGSTYTQLRPPYLKYAVDFTAEGITASGSVILNVLDYGNFLYSNGSYKKIPISNVNAAVYGINPSGTIMVGALSTNSGNNNVGFVYRNNRMIELNFPGADNTVATGVNDSGVVVGAFSLPGSLDSHGFTWTPPAAEEKNKE